MKIQAEKIEIVSLELLGLHPKNMNQHPENQIDRLIKLIEYQGMRNPLVVQKGTGLIVSGNGRFMALKKMGVTHAPVIYQEFESESQLYAYMVSDNAIQSWSTLDKDMINVEMLNYDDVEIDLLGMKEFSLIDPVDLDDSFEKPEPEKKFILEIIFPNDCEMADIRDDLLSRGYLVREK